MIYKSYIDEDDSQDPPQDVSSTGSTDSQFFTYSLVVFLWSSQL